MFPLSNYRYEIPTGIQPGAFGAVRKHDIHTGVDLYCNLGDSVFSIEEGTVISIEEFTGTLANSPWWNDTKAVLVKGKSGVILYGELDPSVSVGQFLQEGQIIGNVIAVLKKYKGKTPTTMLHMEQYSSNITHSVIWNLNETKPTGLVDVTPILMKEFARIAQ